jgi:hypothetical protein
MWFPWRWTKVIEANIPIEQRAGFDRMGVAMVSQILGRDLAIPGPGFVTGYSITLPKGAPDQGYAWLWLMEQHTRDERRRDIGEFVEISILFLVGVEALPILFSACVKCWQILSQL